MADPGHGDKYQLPTTNFQAFRVQGFGFRPAQAGGRRELKECRWRMRLARAAGLLTPAQDPVIVESDELVRIVATIIRNAESGDG